MNSSKQTSERWSGKDFLIILITTTMIHFLIFYFIGISGPIFYHFLALLYADSFLYESFLVYKRKRYYYAVLFAACGILLLCSILFLSDSKWQLFALPGMILFVIYSTKTQRGH